MLRVNIGCGATPTPGWANFDNSPTVWLARHPTLLKILSGAGLMADHQLEFARVVREQEISRADATRKIPLPDRSAAAVYSSHMFEHLDRAEAASFLAEVQRVLAPGGVLRLAVPDLWRLARRYVEETRSADEFVASTYLANEKPRGALGRLKYAVVGARHHHWMYDAASLQHVLEAAGFCNVAEMPPGVTTIPDPGELNLREREDETIYVEAHRP